MTTAGRSRSQKHALGRLVRIHWAPDGGLSGPGVGVARLCANRPITLLLASQYSLAPPTCTSSPHGLAAAAGLVGGLRVARVAAFLVASLVVSVVVSVGESVVVSMVVSVVVLLVASV